MRWLLLCLGLAATLGAQGVVQIVAVERRGPPPYESADRIYRLDGGLDRGLKAGDQLVVRRKGESVTLGQLKVIEVREDRAYAHFEPQDTRYPMKGDLAHLVEQRATPGTPDLKEELLKVVDALRSTSVAPSREGVLFFLPQQAELSPVGLKKLEAWVQEWGTGGRWAVQVPTARIPQPSLQNQRMANLRGVLRRLGVELVSTETEPRSADSKYDPAWIRHWD